MHCSNAPSLLILSVHFTICISLQLLTQNWLRLSLWFQTVFHREVTTKSLKFPLFTWEGKKQQHTFLPYLCHSSFWFRISYTHAEFLVVKVKDYLSRKPGLIIRVEELFFFVCQYIRLTNGRIGTSLSNRAEEIFQLID